MPVYLKIKDDELHVKLSGIGSTQEFADQLARVKQITGKRWEPSDKSWRFPLSPEKALQLMNAVEPQATPEVQQLVINHRAAISESLVTAIASDGMVKHPTLRNCLFPYQRAFVEWAQTHPHCLLADEMGVGKTAEALGAVHEYAWRTSEKVGLPALVVVPNGLRRNWRTAILHGPRERDGTPIYPDWPGDYDVQLLDGANIAKRRQQLAGGADFFVVNWEKLRSDADMLARWRWGAIIADEVHRAKNRKAQQTRGLLKLHAPLQLALSGSPVMNSPDELWTLLAWIRPEQYGQRVRGGGFWDFHYSYVDEYGAKWGRVMRGIKNADDLRFELADKMVRRTKAEVLPDLPVKLPPTVIEVELNDAERRLYKEAETAFFLDAVNFAKREAERRTSTDELISQEELESRADAHFQEIAEELAAMPLERLSGMIENGAARITALRQITARAKAREAVELIRDNPTVPIVTFTWYVEPAQWIADQLRADKLRVGFAAGQGADATEEAHAFQAGEYDQFVGTIAKGGQGLDLYRASTVILADQDWVPAINQQAVDRLHRQGQTSDVSTIILQVEDTVDTGKVAPANRFKERIVQELFGA